jgi:hypothetical protein
MYRVNTPETTGTDKIALDIHDKGCAKEIVQKRLCKRDYAKEIVQKKLCKRDCAKEIVQKRLCKCETHHPNALSKSSIA